MKRETGEQINLVAKALPEVKESELQKHRDSLGGVVQAGCCSFTSMRWRRLMLKKTEDDLTDGYGP